MAKIVLDTVTGGYDLSIINNNFDKIETELQNKVLYRDNPVGEPNTLQTDIDTNGKKIYNLPEPLLDSQAARLQDVQNALAGGAANLIEFTPYGTLASLNVQSAIQEIVDEFTTDAELAAHVAALAASSGSSLIGFTQQGTGAVTQTVQNKLYEIVSVKDFGASSAASAATNLAAFKAAVAATAVGGKLIVPVAASFYSIDTSGGLSTAIDVNKRMEIVFEGDVKATFGTMQANPPYIFNVTGDGVTFSGKGKLIGNGTIDDTNSGDITTFPGLVHVTGDEFTFSGPVIDTPPKVGIALNNCEKAKIALSTFMGGPSSYTIGNTAHFAVYASLGGQHIISDNHFVPSATNGIFTNCIFFSETDKCIISGNIVKGAWEKLSYLYGDYNTVSNNKYEAPVGGNHSDAYRHVGSYNILSNNIAIGANGGCQVFDGVGNQITNNQFIGCVQAGIIVSKNDVGYVGGFNNTKIIGNTVTGGIGTKTDGIRVLVDGLTSKYITVSNNIVDGMTNVNTEGLIRVLAVTPFSVEQANISGNVLSSGTNGIYLDRVVRSKVSDNVINSVTAYALSENGGAFNSFTDNQSRSVTSIGIQNLAASSRGVGNQYTDAALVSTVTLSAAVTTTVTHGGVAANARTFLQTANNTAGIMIVSKGWPTTGISGTDLTIAMANGTAAAGTEQFHYHIIQ